MQTKEEALKLLNQALELEIAAEQNCKKLLEVFTANGFHKSIEHIKNDEVHHQEWVRQIIKFLD